MEASDNQYLLANGKPGNLVIILLLLISGNDENENDSDCYGREMPGNDGDGGDDGGDGGVGCHKSTK